MAQTTQPGPHGPIDLRVPYDSQVDRNRPLRWIVFGLTIMLILSFPLGIGWYLGSLTGYGTASAFGALVGFGIGATTLESFVGKYLAIYNAEWTGNVTNDSFAGTMVPYGPGLHPSLPWEVRNKEGNYPLHVITKAFQVGISTKTARVVVDGEYQYQMDLPLIVRAIGVDATTIENGLTAFVDARLTAKGAGQSADEIRSEIENINEELRKEFMDDNVPDIANIREQYGFRTVGLVIDRITLPEDVQRTRDALDEAEQLNKVMLALYGISKAEFDLQRGPNGSITPAIADQMLTRAMGVSRNAEVKVNVIDIPGLNGIATGLGSIGPILGRLFGDGGTSGPQAPSSPPRNQSRGRGRRRRRGGGNPNGGGRP